MGATTTTRPLGRDIAEPDTRAQGHGHAAATGPAANDRRGRLSLRTINLGLLLLAVLACAYVARTLLFPIIMAVVLALLLRPGVTALQRLGIGESVGAAFVLALALAAVGVLATYLYEPAARWAESGIL